MVCVHSHAAVTLANITHSSPRCNTTGCECHGFSMPVNINLRHRMWRDPCTYSTHVHSHARSCLQHLHYPYRGILLLTTLRGRGPQRTGHHFKIHTLTPCRHTPTTVDLCSSSPYTPCKRKLHVVTVQCQTAHHRQRQHVCHALPAGYLAPQPHEVDCSFTAASTALVLQTKTRLADAQPSTCRSWLMLVDTLARVPKLDLWCCNSLGLVGVPATHAGQRLQCSCPRQKPRPSSSCCRVYHKHQQWAAQLLAQLTESW